jgi:integrase
VTILRGTLAAPSPKLGRYKAATRRWVPWLCAYTGARVGEITQARSQDVAKVDGIWTLNITPEAGTVKTNRARVVPLHDHLIEQGFLDFVASCDGPLFYQTRANANPDARAPYKLAANRLAQWVRELGVTEVPQPNHSWRHTFKTLSRTVGMPEGAADYIQGHAPANDSRAYGSHDLATLAAEIAKLPRFSTD